MNINFVKMAGNGNDFIVIDNRNQKIKDNKGAFAKMICTPKWSVGADGLLLIERSKKADFFMRIFNPDGGEAEMCGNGARCAAKFYYMKFPGKSNISMETKAGIIQAHVKKDGVKLKMTEPSKINLDLKLKLREMTKEVSFINTGVPHVVFFTDNLDVVNVVRLGSDIRYHGEFAPDGTNVNFVQIVSDRDIKIRTYERGVEGETLACGTGSVASSIISCLKKNLIPPIEVLTKGGKLKVYFKKNGKICDVYLEGEARVVYNGNIEVNFKKIEKGD